MDRLVASFDADGRLDVRVQRSGDLVQDSTHHSVEWASPLDAAALEDLRWYLEDYLTAPFAVYEARGARIQQQLPLWGGTSASQRPGPTTRHGAGRPACPRI